jgi:GMP synthase (glutamine-hydrolysing)
MGHAGFELDSWMPAAEEGPPRPVDAYRAVITFGGAMHVDQERNYPWLAQEKSLLADLLERGVPLLGVCLGAQLLAEAAGGTVRSAAEPEVGWFEVQVSREGAADPLLGPLAPAFEAFEWHSYEFALPAGAGALARSARCLQAYRVNETAWGIQFHAEVGAEDAERWIDECGTDEAALRAGVDERELRKQTRAAIAGWNELGRELCERFLGFATRA